MASAAPRRRTSCWTTVPVVDASIVVDWVAPDADPDGPALALLGRLAAAEDMLFAPRLLWEEVANALLTGIRRQRWDGPAADRSFTSLATMPVRPADVPADIDRAWDLSRRYDEHPIYDMVYVAMAERLGQRLLTADSALVTRVNLSFVELAG